MRFDVETHDHGALFSMIAKKQRGHVATEANDAARRPAAKSTKIAPPPLLENEPLCNL